MNTHTDDHELVVALATDAAAFEVFYRRHVDRVIRFAARRCADPEEVADIVAATFVVVLTSSRTYDPARGEPAAWLYGIAARVLGIRPAAFRMRLTTARRALRRVICADGSAAPASHSDLSEVTT